MKIILITLVLFCVSHAQTLNQEYTVKVEYKNSNPTFQYDTTRNNYFTRTKKDVVIVFGKSYQMENSYYDLDFAVLPNGDCIVLVKTDVQFDYMDKICSWENRFKVHIGNTPIDRSTHRDGVIWLLRKRK